MQDHTIDVPGVGVFTFRRRVMRDEFRIGAEYSRLTEGVEAPTNWLDAFASAFSTLKVLIVEAPAGWDMDKLDPLDNDSYANVMGVFGSLRAAEARFRQGSGAGGQGSGAGNGGNNQPLVSPPVPPAAQ